MPIIEDENHFLFECNNTIRNCKDFDVMNYENRLRYLTSALVVKLTAEFIYLCYCKRDFIYN